MNSAPVITSAAALTSPENRLTVGTITATDANVDPLTYAIVGGADAARFTIDAQTGLLRFVSAPNYEAPADAGANNVYDLTVSVSDGIAPAVTQAITVTVTDRAENGITGSNVFDVDRRADDDRDNRPDRLRARHEVHGERRGHHHRAALLPRRGGRRATPTRAS